LLRQTAQQNEASPAEFYCSLEEGVPERVAPAVFGIPQRREFPGEHTVRFLLWRYLKRAEHLRKLVFCSGSKLFTQSTMWVLISRCFVLCGAFFSLSINPPKSLCACSPCFISRRAKLNTSGAKTALREILLLL
jgi:hypothetical protein